jgi:hypothetical protein
MGGWLRTKKARRDVEYDENLEGYSYGTALLLCWK